MLYRLEFVADAGDTGLYITLAALVVLAQPHEPRPFLALGETGLCLSPREFIAQLREFHLQLGLSGLGALAEYLQDEGEAVVDLDALGESVAEVIRLVRPQTVVEDHRAGTRLAEQGGDLVRFPLADVVRGVLLAHLGNLAEHLVAAGAGELADLLGLDGPLIDPFDDDRGAVIDASTATHGVTPSGQSAAPVRHLG